MFTTEESLELTNLFSDLLNEGYNESDIYHELDDILARLVDARKEEENKAKKEAVIEETADLLYRTLDTYLYLTQSNYKEGDIAHIFPNAKELTNYINTIYATAILLTKESAPLSDFIDIFFKH